MYKRAKRKGVWKNSNGFTMIETLLAFTVFLGVASLFPLFYQSLYEFDRTIQQGNKEEWDLFHIQLRRELQSSSQWKPDESRLTFSNAEGTVLIEKYQTVLRRRVNQTGHEVMLQNVDNARFYWKEGCLRLDVQFTDGERREARFFPLSALAVKKGEENDE